MKILAIGDPHGDLRKIRRIPKKKIDLILLTGDLGKADLARKRAFEAVERKKRGLPEIRPTKKQDKETCKETYDSSIKVVKYLSKFAPVFTIYGNVEPESSRDREGFRKLRVPFLTDSLRKMKKVKVINNRLANFKGVKIGGLQYFVDTNWVKDFKPADYRKRMKKSKKETDKARRILRWFKEVGILVCHQPPYRYLDKVSFAQAPKHWKGKHAGSKTILDYIRKRKPQYVFCGHIHEGKGKKKIGNTEVYNLGVGGYKIVNMQNP
jgi:Icc-related predicted phosphoesterase